jgi:hypothetical protein
VLHLRTRQYDGLHDRLCLLLLPTESRLRYLTCKVCHATRRTAFYVNTTPLFNVNLNYTFTILEHNQTFILYILCKRLLYFPYFEIKFKVLNYQDSSIIESDLYVILTFDLKMSSDEDSNYDFVVVEFISRGRPGQRQIDLVPSKWIEFDEKKGRLMVKFMPPPYGKEDFQLITQLAKKLADAPEDWVSYNIKVRAKASKLI